MYLKKDFETIDRYLLKNKISISSGLTKSEVNDRFKEKKSNFYCKPTVRKLSDILKNNLITFFNGLNIILAILVLIAGEIKNMLFIIVVILNTLIGIIQEYRAKKAVERLSLLQRSFISVIREKKITNVLSDELVIDDIVILKTGMQIPADLILLKTKGLEINEALLTGESDPIEKKIKDCLYSGSFVTSGSGIGIIFRVGKNTYINKLSVLTRKFKIVNSELRNSIDKILKFLTLIIVPIGILLFISQSFFIEQTFSQAILKTVAGVIGIIPEGLVLLTSISFTASIIYLSKYKTLVQDLPAMESFARIDVLCLDKTGTLTENILNVIKIIHLKKESSEKQNIIISTYVHELRDNCNETSKALLKYYKNETQNIWKIKNKVSFSSERKWSSITLDNNISYIMGASELFTLNKSISKKIKAFSMKGYRVICFGKSKNSIKQNILPKQAKLETLILLQDKIRESICDVLNFFKKQNISIKVISGDSVETTVMFSKNAGIIDADKYIDFTKINNNKLFLKKIVETNTVFGRTSPQQKKDIICALKENGHIVGMIGDGINDILAIKEADCGISIVSGSEATRAISQLVLLDSNFKALPIAFSQGRKIIVNIERVASIFLVKSVYSIVLSIFVTAFGFSYPFTPIQISLIGGLAIGIPSFFLALEPNKENFSSKFFEKILSIAIPGGLMVSFSLLSINFLNDFSQLNFSHKEMATMLVFATGLTQLFVLFKVSKPLNIWRIILIFIMLFLFVSCFFIQKTIYFFNLTNLTFFLALISIVFTILSSILVIFGEFIIKILFKFNLKINI